MKLSYVLTTFNKLEYLRVTLPRLVEMRKEDEEIVVVDGASRDGTREYLQSLADAGKIQCFLSEPDFGEGNGYNKAMLLAKGELIKIISDDDAYDYRAIQACKQLMLDSPELDIVGADGFGVDTLKARPGWDTRDSRDNYRLWKKSKRPFIFCGLSLMLRRSSLPLLGLWSTNYLIIDFEYTLRVSAGKAKIGWFQGMVYANILNPGSNSGRYWQRLAIEREQLETLYGLRSKYSIPFQYRDRLRGFFRPLKHWFLDKLKRAGLVRPPERMTYEAIYGECLRRLDLANRERQLILLDTPGRP